MKRRLRPKRRSALTENIEAEVVRRVAVELKTQTMILHNEAMRWKTQAEELTADVAELEDRLERLRARLPRRMAAMAEAAGPKTKSVKDITQEIVGTVTSRRRRNMVRDTPDDR
jgi:hypothetical protein